MQDLHMLGSALGCSICCCCFICGGYCIIIRCENAGKACWLFTHPLWLLLVSAAQIVTTKLYTLCAGFACLS